MTTIAWDGKTLAADTLSTWDGARSGYVSKIAKRGNLLAGVTGNAVICRSLLDWFRSGMIGEPPSAGSKGAGDWSTLNLFGFDGLVLTYGPDGWESVKSEAYANGSGCDYALGAMSAGCDARRAVEIAMMHDTRSGGEVQSISVR